MATDPKPEPPDPNTDAPIWTVPEAEARLLGHMVTYCDQQPDPFTLVADRLSTADFADPKAAMVYGTVCELAEDGETYDAVAVLRRIRSNRPKAADEMGPYLGSLIDAAGWKLGPRAVLAWARQIRDDSRRRGARRAAMDLVTRTSTAEGDPGAALAEAHETITRLTLQAWEDDSEDRSLALATDSLMELYERGDDPARLKTGLESLDKLLVNMRRGTLTVLAGSTSFGKTALGIHIADNIAAHIANSGEQSGVLFVSLEMAAEEIHKRRLHRQSGIPEAVFRRFFEPPPGFKDATRAAERELRRRPFDVRYGSLTIGDIRAMARRRKARAGLSLLVVDYIGLIAPTGSHDNREQEVNAATRGLKGCAMELECAVLALAQLNREVHKHGQGAPELAHLRDSGSVEQHADNVLMIHRDKRDDTGVLTLTVRKQRNGRLGAVKLRFAGDVFTFKDVPMAEEWSAKDWSAN